MFDYLSDVFGFMSNHGIGNVSLLAVAIAVLIISGIGLIIRGNK